VMLSEDERVLDDAGLKYRTYLVAGNN
jgi:hypothetical protein